MNAYKQKLRELDHNEVNAVSGGVDPVTVAGLVLAVFAMGYQIGKDLAESENR